MHFVYILYSKDIDQYYVGETVNVLDRVFQHNAHKYLTSFTARAKDWDLKLKIECNDRKAARAIEAHINRNGSRKYKERLINEVDLVNYLLNKYNY